MLFLVFINDLPEGLRSNIKIFADDTSLFSKIQNTFLSSNILNSDLRLIADWADQWKMSFNPDPSKQAIEVIFSKKTINTQHSSLTFSNDFVCSKDSHKHLGMILDKKLTFNHHLKEKVSKANKGIGLITRLYAHLPRKTLINIYKAFVRPHLDYGDIIYDNPGNDTFCHKIESVQYNAALAITGAIRGTSREKLYQELGFEHLSDRRWCRRLCFFYKIKNKQTATYLRELLPSPNSSYNLRTNKIHNTPTSRTERFQFSFFPYCISKWNQLNPELQNSVSLQSFKRSLLLFIRPTASPIYTIHHARGLKLLTRLRLGLSHLREHKFRHNFNDTINPFCPCGTNSIESAEHFLLHCPNFSIYRCSLFDSLRQNEICILPYSSSYLVKILLFGNDKFNIKTNKNILTSVIDFIIQSKRFDGPLF